MATGREGVLGTVAGKAEAAAMAASSAATAKAIVAAGG